MPSRQEQRQNRDGQAAERQKCSISVCCSGHVHTRALTISDNAEGNLTLSLSRVWEWGQFLGLVLVWATPFHLNSYAFGSFYLQGASGFPPPLSCPMGEPAGM